MHVCLRGRFTAFVMTCVPLPELFAYYQLASVGASASMNYRLIITFNKHLDVHLAGFHLAWNITSVLNYNETSYVEQFVSVCKLDVFIRGSGSDPA